MGKSRPRAGLWHGGAQKRDGSMHEAKARLEKPTTVILVEDRAGAVHEIEPVEGWRLMEILRDYGLGMDNTCGGALACAECHVLIDPEWVAKLPPPREDELEKLDELPLIFENSRLSCQIIWSDDMDGLRLTIPLAV
jgi:2Fe-2S ferredoxin